MLDYKKKKTSSVFRAAGTESSSQSDMDNATVMSPPQMKLIASPFQLAGGKKKKAILDSSQIQKAKAYYANKKADYTKPIVKKIQLRVGAFPDGKIGSKTIKAIARWQKANGQGIDGIAGPRTLPDMFSTGLASGLSNVTYSIGFLGLDWSKLTTTAQRAAAIMNLVNKQIKRAGVPKLKHAMKAMTDAGQFDFTTWTVDISSTLLSKPSLTQAELDDLANTVYHEARHAEQWFSMAQHMATKGKSASQIETKMGIPAKIAKAAAKKAHKKDSIAGLVGKGWYEGVYGSGGANRNKVLGPTGSYADYRNLAEEHDAWRVGDDFDKNIKVLRKLGFGKKKNKKKKKKKST